MSKTNAERQAAFRVRRSGSHARLDILLPSHAAHLLGALAAWHGQTFAEVVARLVHEAAAKESAKDSGFALQSPEAIRAALEC